MYRKYKRVLIDELDIFGGCAKFLSAGLSRINSSTNQLIGLLVVFIFSSISLPFFLLLLGLSATS